MEIFLLSPSSLALGVGGCPEKSNCYIAAMIFVLYIHQRHLFHNFLFFSTEFEESSLSSPQVTYIELIKDRKPNATHLKDSGIFIH